MSKESQRTPEVPATWLLRGVGCISALVLLVALLLLALKEAAVLRQGGGLDIPPNLLGVNVVITGSSSGIGFKAAEHACVRGAQVILHGPLQNRSEQAAAQVRAASGGCRGGVTPLACDLGDFDDVHRFAAAIVSTMPQVNILILNAAWAYGTSGAMTLIDKWPDSAYKAKSGHDRVMAINHLGHFLLTVLLLPHLAPGAAIVVTGSQAMWHTDYSRLMPAVRPRWETRAARSIVSRPWSFYAYHDSKLANLCFSRALRRRLASRRIRVVLHDPGQVRSAIARPRGADHHAKKLYLTYTSSKLWDWMAPTHAGGRLLLECAHVTEPVPDVVISYFFPYQLLRWYMPRTMAHFRMRNSFFSVVFHTGQRMMGWGRLHASRGPECGPSLQDEHWRWSENATGLFGLLLKQGGVAPSAKPGAPKAAAGKAAASKPGSAGLALAGKAAASKPSPSKAAAASKPGPGKAAASKPGPGKVSASKPGPGKAAASKLGPAKAAASKAGKGRHASQVDL